MKKFLFKISLPAVLIMMALCVFVMCKKGVDESAEGPNLDQQQNRSQIVENLVVNFKDKIKYSNDNPGLKLSDPMLMDSCIWYVETTLNFTYADLACEKSNLYFDSVFIEIDLISGRVEISEAISAYNKFEDSLSAQYDDITDANKQFLMSDVFVTTSNSSEATLCMLSAFVGGGAINILSFDPEYDFWWYGESAWGSGGYCGGPNIGTCTNDDAAEQIEKKVRYRAAVPSGRYYPSNSITIECNFENVYVLETSNSYQIDLSNPNDETEDDNYFDYLMYRSYDDFPNPHRCLTPYEPDEMNFYLEKMEYIINTKLYQSVSEIEDLDFALINIWGDFYFIDYYTYYHNSLITYTEFVFTSTQTGEF